MSLLSKFTSKVKEYQRGANERAELKLAKAKTESEREKIRTQLRKERIHRQQEITEARTALLKAEAATKRAKKEVKDIDRDGSIMASLKRSINSASKTKRKTTGKRKKKTNWRKVLIG